MLMETTEYTDRLWDNAKHFKEKMNALGFNTGNSQTPITPVIIGDEGKTMEFSRKLLENGVFVSGIVFPTVPVGTGRVRCMVTAAARNSSIRLSRSLPWAGKWVSLDVEMKKPGGEPGFLIQDNCCWQNGLPSACWL